MIKESLHLLVIQQSNVHRVTTALLAHLFQLLVRSELTIQVLDQQAQQLVRIVMQELIAFTEVKLHLEHRVQLVISAAQVLKILIKTDVPQDLGVRLGLLHQLFVQKALTCQTKSAMSAKLVQPDSNAREQA
jgi:hypothetical protein